MIRIDWKRKRVTVASIYRLHHGFVGLAAVITGLCLCWHDRHDRHDWIPGRDL